ncbi:glutathione S-transferase [Achromobacter xylosoxidans]|uniref:glutathione S-transferase family protein n=1 Tax=Alcaligenes xylosoxydans xylosoxydans TaxID=85698 RepID=UPI00064DEF56|nr:glutathione S-transferase family protein [Achromobacter xylosoxidans]KMJ90544.1 glutathione S-transferase [Achromobacter xylosoxidans]WOB72827.1 glutathione S-transferase family protein [Achromobacter xylosoxidans]
MSIVFYWHPQSSASPIAAALAELQVPHERVKVDIRAGEQRRPEFLAINPNGKVPTLTVDGAPLFEALAIQLWLGEHWGVERGLWPAAGTPQRLAAMSWCAWSYVSYGAVLWRLFHLGHGDEGQRDPRQAERALADLDSLLAVLEGHLARQPWMLGAEYSLADLVVGSVIGYSAMLGAPVAAHPKVQAWLGKVQARPAMQVDR